MSNNANAPTVTSYTLMNVLDQIKGIYGAKEERQSFFQLEYIVKAVFETAVFFALKDDWNQHSFESALTAKSKAVQGIANHYGIAFEPNLSYTKTNFFNDKTKTVPNVEKTLISAYPRMYGLPSGTVVTLKTAQEYINKLSFRVSEQDKAMADKLTVKKIQAYYEANEEALQDEFLEANNAQEIITAITDDGRVEPVPPMPMSKRLTADAQEIVNTSNARAQETWDKVYKIQARLYPDAVIEDLHDLDETQIYYVIVKLSQMYDSSHKSMEERAFQMDKNSMPEKKVAFFREQAAAASQVVSLCNDIINVADDVYKTNTSEEQGSDDSTYNDGNLETPKEFENNISTNSPH